MTILVLTPTKLELEAVEPLLSRPVRQAGGFIELCGFGPIAAAARTMQLIARHQPTRVMLVGIAGSLRPDLEVGAARSFQQVRCDGIGAGTGADHKSASDIGWKQWVPASSAGDDAEAGFGDMLPLHSSFTDAMERGGDLLTVCAASANESDVATRLQRHPDAVAEDMEGFGVAVACHFGAASLEIIRGISNRAGDRDQKNWDIDGALRAACELALKTFSA